MSFARRLYYYAFLVATTVPIVRASLPLEIQTSISTCALDCVSNYVQKEYTTLCIEPFTLNCLCTRYGRSGYALDEGISPCITSTLCNSSLPFIPSPASDFCGGIAGAVIPRSQVSSIPPATSTSTTTTQTLISSTMSFITTTSSVMSTTTTTVSSASVSAGSDGVKVSGELNLTMAQIAGITIAAAALLILTVGIFSCIFFVRKRNKRLEHEDRKILMQTTPKSANDMQDMQAIYFPPPPLSPGMVKVNKRESPRFSIMPRKRSKERDEESGARQVPEISQPQRTWPRYYPIMPNDNVGIGIGIATTTNSSIPSPTYTPAPVPAPAPPPQSAAATQARSTTPNFSLSRNPSTGALPSYQPHSGYASSVHQPQPPAAAYVPAARNTSQSSRSSRTASNARKSKAFSFMTDIEEGEQVSTRETSLAEMSGDSSCESLPSSTATKPSVTPSMKKSRRPTLTINIPGQPKNPGEYPPPPPAKNPNVRMPTVLPGPPPMQNQYVVPNQVPVPSRPAPQATRTRTAPPVQLMPIVQTTRATPPMQHTQVSQAARSTPPTQQSSNTNTSAAPPAPRRMPSNSSAPMLQALARQASQRSAARPKPSLTLDTQKPAPKAPWAPAPQQPATKPATRPPLLREDQVHQIANSPSDILRAASTYARARKPSPESTSRDSVSSAALPSSTLMGPATFLMSDSEHTSSDRSNASARRASRTQSRSGRRASDASVTSFEDDSDSDDETPPKEEVRSLSPVIEASPVSTLRYPKVPRGSNQIVPRSPGTPKKNTQSASPAQNSTPTRTSATRPDVNTAAAAALSQGIGNRLWKTEVSPNGKPMPTPEWSAHRRSASWEKWAQNTPNSALQTPKPPFANDGAPKLTPTRRGDELFLDLRFSASTLGPVSPKRP